MVTWFIGLSGAGKSTLANMLYAEKKAEFPNTVLVDGDTLREVWGDRVGHDIEGRRKNAERLSKLCAWLDDQGIHVIAAVLSLFPEWQDWNRDTFSAYHEVFLDVPMDVLEARDTKGLYAAARSGELIDVAGVDIPFPPPPRPNQHLKSPEVLASPEDLFRHILSEMPEW